MGWAIAIIALRNCNVVWAGASNGGSSLGSRQGYRIGGVIASKIFYVNDRAPRLSLRAICNRDGDDSRSPCSAIAAGSHSHSRSAPLTRNATTSFEFLAIGAIRLRRDRAAVDSDRSNDCSGLSANGQAGVQPRTQADLQLDPTRRIPSAGFRQPCRGSIYLGKPQGSVEKRL